MRVRAREQGKKGESLPATGAATTTDVDPVVVFIVGLLAAAPMADDGIAFTSGASARDDFGTAHGPLRFELVRRGGKWDKQNRSSSGLCPSGVDLPRSEPEAELLPPQTNDPTGKEYSFSYGLLGMGFRELAGNNRQSGSYRVADTLLRTSISSESSGSACPQSFSAVVISFRAEVESPLCSATTAAK